MKSWDTPKLRDLNKTSKKTIEKKKKTWETRRLQYPESRGSISRQREWSVSSHADNSWIEVRTKGGLIM